MNGLKMLPKQFFYVLISATLLLSYFPAVASAAQITARKVVIGSSASNVSTTYQFIFTVPQSTVLKSASFTACTTPSGACTAVPGFSATSATLTSQPVNLGDATGWAVNNGTENSLRLSKTANSAAPTGSQTVSFSNVHNPSAENETFFIRITTYSDDAWTTAVDAGTVASSTAGQVTVSVLIDEKLTFTLANTTVSLTQPSTTSTGTGSSSMTVSTNASTGYSVNYTGSTLTSGSNTIAAMAAAAGSAVNTPQFGLNLMANVTPPIGSNTTGSGSGAPVTGYNTADQFKFNTAGDVVATAPAATNDNIYTTSYIVNTNGSTAAGLYSTILTYIATANF